MFTLPPSSPSAKHSERECALRAGQQLVSEAAEHDHRYRGVNFLTEPSTMVSNAIDVLAVTAPETVSPSRAAAPPPEPKAASDAANDENFDMKQRDDWLFDFPPAVGPLQGEGLALVEKWAKKGDVVIVSSSDPGEPAVVDECATVLARLQQIASNVTEADPAQG